MKIIWQRTIKIIITDDHALVRKGVRMAVEKWNDLEIIGEATNGQELLDLLETVIPDIVILNITMPIMNGIETLPRIRKKYPDLKVVVLTMHSAPEMVARMMRLGANTYLTKGTESNKICEAIRSVYEYGSYYSDAMQEVLLAPYAKAESQKQEFTHNELKILDLLTQNKSVKEMSRVLGYTERTVATIMNNLKKKVIKDQDNNP